MKTEYRMTFGSYQGVEISNKKISLKYLRQLEEDLLMRGTPTSDPLMQALDHEIRRREKVPAKYLVKKEIKEIVL